MSYSRTFSFVLIVTLLSACKKDKLENEFDAFEGKWKWIYTLSRTSLFSDWDTRLRPENRAYDAYVEFTNEGTIKLFIDDQLLEEVKYRVVDETQAGNYLQLRLDFNTKTNDLNLSGERGFALNNDTLSFGGFLFNSYEKSQDEINSGYYVRE